MEFMLLQMLMNVKGTAHDVKQDATARILLDRLNANVRQYSNVL